MLQSKPHCAPPHVLPYPHPTEELAQVPPLDSDSALSPVSTPSQSARHTSSAGFPHT